MFLKKPTILLQTFKLQRHMLFIKEIIDQSIQFNIFAAVFVFYKIDNFLLSSLLNRILSVGSVSIGLVDRWVGGSWI